MKRAILLLLTGTLTALSAVVVVVTSAQAATACRATYTVTNAWPGGFQASVSIANLADPLNGWTVRFTFPDSGQRVSQGWNGTWTQSGNVVTVTNATWNPSVGTGATLDLGFLGALTGANPVPTAFSVNGVACTGTVPPTNPTTTTTRPPTTTTTRPPTTTTTTTRPPTTPPTTGWNPPANLVTPLNEVWAHQESTYGNLYGFRNYGWDQVMANGGSINYCVRWDSSAPVSATLRDQIHSALSRQFAKWMNVMAGHNGWPYANVPVRVVGWAVRDRNTLQWSDNSVDIYVNNIRENAPQCSEPCGRFFHQDGNYGGCPGGASRHYDMSLWLTAGFGGGAGGDWGQRMGSEYFVNNRSAENITILLHEIGHSFGLDDFYDWTPSGQCCFIMKAGSASQITEFDAWMFRDWWRHLKSRYGR